MLIKELMGLLEQTGYFVMDTEHDESKHELEFHIMKSGAGDDFHLQAVADDRNNEVKRIVSWGNAARASAKKDAEQIVAAISKEQKKEFKLAADVEIEDETGKSID